MEALLKFLLGTSMASVLFFSQPAIYRDANHLFITGELNGAVTEKVERIINTGAQINIIYYVSIYSISNNGTKILRKKLVNSIKYNHLQGIYTLNLNGTVSRTDDRKTAYSKLRILNAEFGVENIDSMRFRDCYIDASIEYDSSLKLDIPSTVLWEYYMPYIKVEGDIKFK
jgi:hypothetical protein